MRTGDLPSCQTAVPYKLQLKDRRHGGGLGNDSNNDYGLAPPNRNLVRYMVKRSRGKKEVKNKAKVSNDKPSKDEKRNKHETDVGSLIRDEVFDSKSLKKSHQPGSLDGANGNGTDYDTQQTASQSKVTGADNKKVPVPKNPNLAKSREENTEASAQSLIGAKDRGNDSNPRSSFSQRDHVNKSQTPVAVPGQRALGKSHIRVVVPTDGLSSASYGTDADDDDYERIWSAENSEEEVSGKQSNIRQPLDNRSRLKLSRTLRPANNRPSLLSIDDFSNKAKNSSGILYRRRQAQELYSDNTEESKPISVVFSKGPVEIYSRGQVEFNAHNTPVLNSYPQKVNVRRRNTIHNPGIEPIKSIHKQNYGHLGKTVYKQSSRQPRQGLPPMKLPPISAPSGQASVKKEHYKIGDFTSQRQSSEEYALW